MTQKIIVFTILLLFIATAHMALADKRTALVIGNGAYKSSILSNPGNDAADMARVLKQLGFDVILKKDAGKELMLDAFREFGRKLSGSEVGLFYYAGHGMQIKGVNYLIPVNNNIQEESEVEFEAIDVRRILAKMQSAGNPLNIVILDACRDNPFKRSFRASQKGFVQMDAPLGTVIAYATSPGSVAADGKGRNGTYTEALLRNFQNPDLDVQKMFNTTGLDVMKKTDKKQVPWVSTSPFPDYYLAKGILPPSSGKSNVKAESVQKPVIKKSAEPNQGDTWTDPERGMEFVYVHGGCFQMGQTQVEKQYLLKESGKEKYKKYFKDELPRHEVCLDGFWMAKSEVNRGQFAQFIRETGYRTDADKKGTAWINNKDTDWKWKEMSGYNWEKAGYYQEDTHPAVCVSWNDAKAFIKWLSVKTDQNFALPTEAQWEYAARGGTDFMRFWGPNDSEACKYANVADKENWNPSFPCNDGYKFTAPVDTFRANPFGLYDMLGNVWEWCEDIYDKNAYSKHSRNNPLITSGGSSRVIRGGSWSNDPWSVRAANRSGGTADSRSNGLGFRLCLSRVRQ
jgi:formylglycine-generating enzyme required for sulfatase activity